MQDRSEFEAVVSEPKKPSLNRSRSWLSILIGILIGMLVMIVLFIGIYALGYVCFTEYDCPAPEIIEIIPPPEVLAGLCPPCESLLPTPTVTPDLGATATVACATFDAQFPGTPCPSQ